MTRKKKAERVFREWSLEKRLWAIGVGTSAAAYASYAAPAGFVWDFVTFNTEPVLFNNEPVVSLVRNPYA